jgi:tRNA (guanine-N7-)-methyltransferase
MGKKKKLRKFAENLTFPNMFQPNYDDIKDGFVLKGNWKQEFFKNDNPITLEVGCGKGEYTVGLAAKYPDRNFIGMDIKGARMWRGCHTSQQQSLQNVAFIRAHVQMVPMIFAPAEVEEIWITFPDPQPKNAKRNKRLTAHPFLERYYKILASNGLIHFKTDNEPLFDYTLEVIASEQHHLLTAVKDLYQVQGFEEVKSIKTYYETLFSEQGFAINYLEFKLNPAAFTTTIHAGS